jgi:prophage regulatory protein
MSNAGSMHDLEAVLERMVRKQERRILTGVGPTRWREMELEGAAPRRRILGPRSVGWMLSELLAWIKSRPIAPGGDANLVSEAEQTAPSADITGRGDARPSAITQSPNSRGRAVKRRRRERGRSDSEVT